MLPAGADRAPGPLAAAPVLLHRLRGEAPDLDAEGLSVLATVDGADEELLAALAGTSTRGFRHARPAQRGPRRRPRPRRRGALPVRVRLGVPLAQTGTGDAGWRPGRSLAATAGSRAPATRGCGPGSRADLFAEPPGPMRVRPGTAADAGAMGRLTRQRAATEGLDDRGADRMLQRWLDGAEHGFHMLVDGEDRPVGMVNLTPFGAGPAPVLEPLLQQHAEAAGRANAVYARGFRCPRG
nr:hypothetical protein GCM10020063_006960 [Dactylosporangium thailandense]